MSADQNKAAAISRINTNQAGFGNRVIWQLSDLRNESRVHKEVDLLIFIDGFELKKSSREFSRMNTNQNKF
jgi:hypothetical protein